MNRWRARVQRGRLVLDAPTDMPDGTIVDLVLADEGDDLDRSERAALHVALTRASDSADRGDVRPVADLLFTLCR